MKKDLLTGGIPNGYWIEASAVEISNAYILGVADGMLASRQSLNDSICRDNSNIKKNNVVENVRQYYARAPENKFRQIAAVIRSGCV